MQALLIRIRRDPSLGAAALPIFRRAIRFEGVGWIAALAARGVEEIEGAAAGRQVWMELLGRESPDIVASAAGSSTDPFYLPALTELLDRRTEPKVRGAAIRGLGRIPDPSVFPAIVRFLDDPALRVSVIEALADQGDERARPHLQRLVEDETEIGEFDERGAPIRIGYLAWNAIRRFDEPDLARHYAPDRFRPFAHEPWGDPVPPMLGGPPPFRFEPATQASAPPPPARSAPPTPPSPAPAPRTRFGNPGRSFVLPTTFKGFHLVALVPLALAFVQVAWTVVLVVALAEAIRVGEKTPLQTHAFEVLGMIPGVLGVLAAMVIPLFRRLKALEYLALVVGALACLPLVILFARDLFSL
jgi:hypothetical protein